jgi:hypothetical protein
MSAKIVDLGRGYVRFHAWAAPSESSSGFSKNITLFKLIDNMINDWRSSVLKIQRFSLSLTNYRFSFSKEQPDLFEDLTRLLVPEEEIEMIHGNSRML